MTFEYTNIEDHFYYTDNDLQDPKPTKLTSDEITDIMIRYNKILKNISDLHHFRLMTNNLYEFIIIHKKQLFDNTEVINKFKKKIQKEYYDKNWTENKIIYYRLFDEDFPECDQ